MEQQQIGRAELSANLAEYQSQLEQVEALLLNDPENEEYNSIYEGLAEVIRLTRDLLSESGEAETGGLGHAAFETAPRGPAAAAAAREASQPVAAITSAPELRLPTVLPPQVAQQIREAQQRAALAGQAPPAWAISAKVQAVYSGDGQWYDAAVEAVSAQGNFIVAFDGYDIREEVERQQVRVRAEEGKDVLYQGVAAPKRRAVDSEAEIDEMPQWLEVKPTDDEKTKAKKKKLQKSYKSKLRFQRMDVAQKQKADAWKSFMTGKGAKKKSGFLTGRKKDSMFKVPEGTQAKVGVIGSGQSMTQYQKRARHDFAEDSAADGGD